MKLDCDMLAYGVGAVLSHIFLNGVKRPCNCLCIEDPHPQSERGYAQLEKETLSCVWNPEVQSVSIWQAIHLGNGP